MTLAKTPLRNTQPISFTRLGKMIRNEIDDFRQAFFQTIIDKEIEDTRLLKQKQRTCFHTFKATDPPNAKGYQTRTCSKCELSDCKKVTVWEGTKNCVIS